MLTIIIFVLGLFILAVMGERLYTLEKELAEQRRLNVAYEHGFVRDSRS